MTLDAKVNGSPIAYTQSPLEKLYERLSLCDERHFYTKRDGGIIRVRLHPAYLDRDMFRYQANVLNDGREMSIGLEDPRKELIEIITPEFDGKISVERDLRKGRVLIRKISQDKSLSLIKTFKLSDSLDAVERYVRSLY